MSITRYQTQWGEHVLDEVDVSVESGRDLLVFEPVRGDGGITLDRGPVLRRASVSVVWLERDETDDPGARRDAFLDAVSTGATALYWHPMSGAFPAKVGRISESYVDGNIADTVEFVEDRGSDFAPVEPQAGTAPRAGADTVAVAADTADDAIDNLELESSETEAAKAVTANTRDLSRGWQDESLGDSRVDARQVYVDLAEAQQSIQSQIVALDLATDIDRYAAYVAFVELGSELSRAADAATSAVSSTYEYRVDRTRGLLSLVIERYGAAEATLYYARVRALNRIDRPVAIAAGTVLTLPVPA